MKCKQCQKNRPIHALRLCQTCYNQNYYQKKKKEKISKVLPNYGTIECRHCQKDRDIDRRGLCRDCYRNPSIRKHYPTIPCGRRGIGHPGTKTLPKPTQALPGTEEKILVLMERVKQNQILFHPDDARLPVAETSIIQELLSQEDEEDE
jgi:hypothetical protein